MLVAVAIICVTEAESKEIQSKLSEICKDTTTSEVMKFELVRNHMLNKKITDNTGIDVAIKTLINYYLTT